MFCISDCIFPDFNFVFFRISFYLSGSVCVCVYWLSSPFSGNSMRKRPPQPPLVEIEALKHAPSWGLRHRRDSISGLSTQSQPLGYAFGTQSPAPTFHSGMTKEHLDFVGFKSDGLIWI